MNKVLFKRTLNEPLLVDESYAAHLQGIKCDVEVNDEPAANTFEMLFGQTFAETRKHYPVVEGIAMISVWGSLEHKSSWAGTYYTGYDAITSKAQQADNDPDVKGIMFDVNSPGGEVAGCFEASDVIKNLQKPTMAVVDNKATSAAYAIASACDEIACTQSGSVGSIGVVMLHVDQSKSLESAGIKPTLIYSGEHKVEGNSYEPLSDKTKAKIQTRLDTLRDQFASIVAENRGLDVESVMATNADVYNANDALDKGLINAVMSPTEAFNSFKNGLIGSQQEVVIMTDKTKERADTENGSSITASDLAQAKSTGATDMQSRIESILASDAAEGRTELAQHLAFKTSMSADEAVALMAVSAKQVGEKAESKGSFDEAMNNSDNPNVGADKEGSDEVAFDPFNPFNPHKL